MVDMSDTATYTPGRHKPFDLTAIEWSEDLPPKPEKKPANSFEGQLANFAEFIRNTPTNKWGQYPFTYKSAGGATAARGQARKAHGAGLIWECRDRHLYAKAVAS